ncbi:uncharacterized protein LOC114752816 [Neltuma alba]|uniref:uncharacterized protein LOC114752816 n=1 Tax=Neltuma alba TaxID=207710 RepID=UPI0010A3FCE4|nr:uncharacterized protein LOC114752816 [Prosopis alba]
METLEGQNRSIEKEVTMDVILRKLQELNHRLDSLTNEKGSSFPFSALTPIASAQVSTDLCDNSNIDVLVGNISSTSANNEDATNFNELEKGSCRVLTDSRAVMKNGTMVSSTRKSEEPKEEISKELKGIKLFGFKTRRRRHRLKRLKQRPLHIMPTIQESEEEEQTLSMGPVVMMVLGKACLMILQNYMRRLTPECKLELRKLVEATSLTLNTMNWRVEHVQQCLWRLQLCNMRISKLSALSKKKSPDLKLMNLRAILLTLLALILLLHIMIVINVYMNMIFHSLMSYLLNLHSELKIPCIKKTLICFRHTSASLECFTFLPHDNNHDQGNLMALDSKGANSNHIS